MIPSFIAAALKVLAVVTPVLEFLTALLSLGLLLAKALKHWKGKMKLKKKQSEKTELVFRTHKKP